MDGTEVGKLHYDLNIDDKNLKSQLDAADAKVKTFGDHIGQYWDQSVNASKKLLASFTVLGVAAVGFGVASVHAFEESQNAIAQTQAVLKSTGSVAGVTADEITKIATALQKVTKFSDEDVRSVENLLLTFTSIGKDIFPQATKIVLDMATALGEDTKGAAIQLGKALQDPILGVTALRRVGVNFNQAQQDVIANLVNTGKSAEAQRLIMAELTKEFGGSAEAAGKTYAGKIAILKNQFNDLQEAMGQTILQGLAPLFDWFGKFIDKINKAGGILAYLNQVFDENKGKIEFLAGAIMGALLPAIVAITLSFAGLLLELSPFIIIGGLLFYLWNNNKLLFWALAGAVTGFAIAIMVALMPAIIAATGGFIAMAIAVIAATWPFILIGAVIGAVAYLIITHWQAVVDFFKGVWDWIKNNWPLLLGILVGPFAAAIGFIVQHFNAIKDFVVDFFKGAASWLYNAGKDLIMGLINGVKDKFNDLKGAISGAVSGAVNQVKGLLGIHSPSTVFAEIGRNVTQGFVQGINDTANLAMNSMAHLGNNIISPTVKLASGGTSSGATTSAPALGGSNIINIGTINDKSDAEYIMRRMDRSQENVSRGVSP